MEDRADTPDFTFVRLLLFGLFFKGCFSGEREESGNGKQGERGNIAGLVGNYGSIFLKKRA